MSEENVQTLDEVENFADETEEVEAPAAEAPKTEAKAAAKPKKGDLPEGYVTPVGLAHKLTELGYGNEDNKPAPEGEPNLVVAPQVVYSYIKNAPNDHPFPNTVNKVLQTVKDSNGFERPAFKLEDGLTWWAAKVERAAARKANAAAKAKAAVKPAAAAPAEEVTEAEGDFTEAE